MPEEEARAARLHARAAAFRADVAALLEPGGLTSAHVAKAASWFDGPVWRLLEEQQRLLAGVTLTDGQPHGC